MIRRGVLIQLIAFAAIAVAATLVLLFRFAGLGTVLSPPNLVRAHFAEAGGIFPRAEVDLLGTSVGTVRDVTVDPSGDVVATLALDRSVHVPADVTATVTDKSALGEQYVELVPHGGGGMLVDGGMIPRSRTATPLPVKELLGNLNTFATSIPTEALATNLVELPKAFAGTGPDLQHLLDQSNVLTRTSLANLNDLIGLINTGRTVLDTQADLGPQIRSSSHDLAGLTDELGDLTPTLAGFFDHSAAAGDQLSGLVRDNQHALPDLLSNALTITDIAHSRQPHLRKTLTMLPWALERVGGAVRYCDENDPHTGKPIAKTCQYDDKGQPQYSARFAFQLPEKPVASDPYNVCIRGYQGTRKFTPSGRPVDGVGPLEQPNEPANGKARCATQPTDPGTPNVRGAQNAAPR